jgi:hypothetical protein
VMGSYSASEMPLNGLRNADVKGLMKKVERAIVLMDKSAVQIDEYLKGLRDASANLERRTYYVINGGKR